MRTFNLIRYNGSREGYWLLGTSWDLLTHECSTIKSTRHDNSPAPFHRQGCCLHTNGLFMGWTGFFAHHTATDSGHMSSACSVRVGLWVCPNRFESSWRGNLWRIHFQDFEYQKNLWYFVTVGLVSCHWQNAAGEGKNKLVRSWRNPVRLCVLCLLWSESVWLVLPPVPKISWKLR